ncbi:MAG: hypothetical protein J5772_03645 [Clostridia bacterium]|nr:hypothetical protein [Clostridia bacterium]
MRGITKANIAIMLSAIIIVSSLCGCAGAKVPINANATPSASAGMEISTGAPAQVHTELPTEAPTAEPTPEPTETPIPEPTLRPIEEFPLPDDPEAIGDCIKDAEVLLYIPFGESEDCAGYNHAIENEDEFDHFPQAFYISGETVYLLDSVNGRVIVSENGNKRYITIPNDNGYAQLGSICVIGETMYICPVEIYWDCIRAFDLDGNELESIPLPEQEIKVSMVAYLTEHDGCLAFVDHSLTLWVLKDGEFVEISKCSVEKILDPEMNITTENGSISFNTGENTHPGLRRLMGDRAYVYVIEYVPGTYDPVVWEMSYRVYYSDGSLAGSTLVDYRNVVGYPNCDMFINSEGELYIMCCMQDGVYITKPHLRTEYVSHLDEIIEADND